jgi:hypothetical protein
METAALPIDVLGLIIQRDIESNYNVFPKPMCRSTQTWRKQLTLYSMFGGIVKWLLVSKIFHFLTENSKMELIYRIAWGANTVNNINRKNSKTKNQKEFKMKRKNWWGTCKKKSHEDLNGTGRDKQNYLNSEISKKSKTFSRLLIVNQKLQSNTIKQIKSKSDIKKKKKSNKLISNYS